MLLSNRMLRMKGAALLAIVMMLSVWLTACGSSQGTPSPQAAAGAGQNAAKSDGTRKVKHAMGESDVPSSPKRVVILTNEGTEALLALGVKPVGAVKAFTGNPWYDHLKADLEGVQVVGEESQPNLELIASLKPDLILGNKMRQEKVYDQLKAIAPTVFSETLRGEWKSNFALYAEALNKKAEGDKIIGAFDKRIEDFKQKAGDKIKQEKVAVVRFMGGKTRFYYGDMFSGVIFKQIGFPRSDPKSDEKAFEDISKERLPELDAADRIFYFTYETGDGKGTKQEQEWLNDPIWKNIKAVKNNKLVRVNDVTWNTAGGVKAANLMLDDLFKLYDVKP